MVAILFVQMSIIYETKEKQEKKERKETVASLVFIRLYIKTSSIIVGIILYETRHAKTK